jgi:hypothetical protein
LDKAITGSIVMRRDLLTLTTLIGFLLFSGLITLGQKSEPVVNPCESVVTKQFDFMIGEWSGVERSAGEGQMKVISTSEIQVSKALNGCVVQERWEFSDNGKKLFSALLFRAFDNATQKWRLSYVDDHLNHQTYEAREDMGKLRFFRQRIVDGKPVLVRITWVSVNSDKFEQVVERSTDGDENWKLRSIITYQRKK